MTSTKKKSLAKMAVILDTKEPKANRNVIRLSLQSAGIAVREESLEVGDFAITSQNSDGGEGTLALFERKTYSDQYQSILDGRYKNQRASMLACDVPIVGYLYVGSPVEAVGNWRLKEPDKVLATLVSSVVHTAIIEKGRLCTIALPDDSWVPHALKKICAYLTEEYNEEHPRCPTTATVRSITKKKSRSRRDVFIAQLACIPGLSSKAALIADKYRSMRNLMEALEFEGPQAVEQISGIGKVLANAVYTSIYKEPSDEEDEALETKKQDVDTREAETTDEDEDNDDDVVYVGEKKSRNHEPKKRRRLAKGRGKN